MLLFSRDHEHEQISKNFCFKVRLKEARKGF